MHLHSGFNKYNYCLLVFAYVGFESLSSLVGHSEHEFIV